MECVHLECSSNYSISLECSSNEQYFRSFAGFVCIAVAVIGTLGNLLTLTAIPWAQRNKILGFNQSTIFILNLAFADFLYCIFNLPVYAITYLDGLPFDPNSWQCKAFAAFRNYNAFVAWMSLGFVAVSRYVSLVHPEIGKILLKKNRKHIIVISIWLYNIILIGSGIGLNIFSYDCDMRKCDFIHQKGGMDPRKIFLSIGFGVPAFLIVFSYTGLWMRVHNSFTLRRQSSLGDIKRQIHSEEIKLTQTLFGVIFCYIICVSPIILADVFDFDHNHRIIYLLSYIVYWCQYALNFVIYAVCCRRYRAVFVRYLQTMFRCLFLQPEENTHNTIFIINPDVKSCSCPENIQTTENVNALMRFNYKRTTHSCSGSIKVENFHFVLSGGAKVKKEDK